jgi:spermidine synthase
MALSKHRAKVVIGGGGDGLAAREVLKWPEVEHVVLVDLDPKMTELGRTHPEFIRLNRHSLSDPRVEIVNADAMVWFMETDQRFDVAILDFPDPNHYSLGKLYSKTFYRKVQQHLTDSGILVAQAASPLFARAAFWCVVETLRELGLSTLPYHAFVPSFGEWGFVLAAGRPLPPVSALPDLELRFLDRAVLAGLFQFAPDLAKLPVRANDLDNQALVGYYVDAWKRWD